MPVRRRRIAKTIEIGEKEKPERRKRGVGGV